MQMPWLADLIKTVMTNRAILASAYKDRTLFCRFVIKKYPLRMTKLDSFNIKSTKKIVSVSAMVECSTCPNYF